MVTQNSKNKGSKSKKKQQPTQPSTTAAKQQSKVARFFTVAICVIVALGLMLPVAGIGAASCSAAPTQAAAPVSGQE